MRLLHTTTLELHDFVAEDRPHYAILSHRWEDEEVTFQDLRDEKAKARNMKGFGKIAGCCERARTDDWEYAWIDSCCIDKTSSSELSEAINSMFLWYRDAKVCYVYLSDVDISNEKISIDSQFHRSQWFSRGWTLQELLAPEALEFFDKNWIEIGTKYSLQTRITKATGIKHLFNFKEACVATKMSWAAKRKTTRLEDQAYCLMGLFGVNMPPLYGEGNNAFLRLQLEILSRTDDESIFAWNGKDYGFGFLDPTPAGLLASSPALFESSGAFQRKIFDAERPPFSMTNKGLRLELTLIPRGGLFGRNVSSTKFVAPLNCADFDSGDDSFLAISLINSPRGWTRSPMLESWDLKRIDTKLELSKKKTIFVKQFQTDLEVSLTSPQRPSLLMFVVQSLARAGYVVFRRYFGGSNDHSNWRREEVKGIIPFLLKDLWIHRSPVALLLRPQSPTDSANLLAVIVGKSKANSLWVDAFLTGPNHSLRNVIDMAADKWDGKIGPDRVTRKLDDGVIISVSVRKRVASETDIYVAEILAERGAGPRWLDVDKEQRIAKGNA